MDPISSTSASSVSAGVLGAMDAQSSAQVAALEKGARNSPQEAARRFEELLGGMLVKEMRNALPEGFFGKGPGADVYGGWLDEHLGKALAENDGLGLRGTILPSLQGEAAPESEQEASE